MRQATLYSASKQLVMVHGGVIPYMIRNPIRVFNDAGSYLDGDLVSHVLHHLPVERWVFDGQDHLVAFDPTLRGIVESLVQTSEDAVRKIAQQKINKLDAQIKQLQAQSVWDTIVHKIKQRWSK